MQGVFNPQEVEVLIYDVKVTGYQTGNAIIITELDQAEDIVTGLDGQSTLIVNTQFRLDVLLNLSASSDSNNTLSDLWNVRRQGVILDGTIQVNHTQGNFDFVSNSFAMRNLGLNNTTIASTNQTETPTRAWLFRIGSFVGTYGTLTSPTT